MSFGMAEVIAAAGVGDPWELAATLPADPGAVDTLRTGFGAAAGFSRDALGLATRADELVAQGFRNDGSGVYDAATATETTRTALGDGGDQLDAVALMLGRVSAQLGTSSEAVGRAISALDIELEAVRAESAALAGQRFPTQADADAASRALFDRAVSAVRTHGTTVATAVQAFDDALSGEMGVLADQGFDGADPAATTGAPPLPPAGAPPAEVAAYWAGLTPEQQAELLRTSPQLLGNLDGLPAEVRDTANRIMLPREIAGVDAEIAELERRLAESPLPVDELDAQEYAQTSMDLMQLREHRAALDAVERMIGQPDRHLLALDTSGEQVQAAIANGDVDTAEHVAVFVPGLSSTVQSPAGNWPGSENITLEAYDGGLVDLRAFAENEAASVGGGTVATVAWLDYQAPQFDNALSPSASVLGQGPAEAGARSLGGFLDGIGASRVDDPHLTLIGHSYGSLVAGLAAQRPVGVDDLVIIGSPGIGTDDLGDLAVPPGHVFVGESDGDVIADANWFGPDPNHLGGVVDLATGPAGPLIGSSGHDPVGEGSYLGPRTTSQHNIGQVVVGAPERTIRGDDWGVLDYLTAPADELFGG